MSSRLGWKKITPLSWIPWLIEGYRIEPIRITGFQRTQSNQRLSNQQTVGTNYVSCSVLRTVGHEWKWHSPCPQGLTVFYISHTVFLPWKEWWLIYSAAENLVVLLSYDCECQSLCPICAQKNQLTGFWLSEGIEFTYMNLWMNIILVNGYHWKGQNSYT